jgi:hypothetical protein
LRPLTDLLAELCAHIARKSCVVMVVVPAKDWSRTGVMKGLQR